VNSLTKYHFKDREDIELLNRLINEENEFVLSCFDVFDSDKDHENLIDSLQRILDKYKLNGFQFQRITPNSFFQSFERNAQYPTGFDYNDKPFMPNTPQPHQVYGLSQQAHN
jgi:hypothetical protein